MPWNVDAAIGTKLYVVCWCVVCSCASSLYPTIQALNRLPRTQPTPTPNSPTLKPQPQILNPLPQTPTPNPRTQTARKLDAETFNWKRKGVTVNALTNAHIANISLEIAYIY